jgi:hypothetical protein
VNTKNKLDQTFKTANATEYKTKDLTVDMLKINRICIANAIEKAINEYDKDMKRKFAGVVKMVANL